MRACCLAVIWRGGQRDCRSSLLSLEASSGTAGITVHLHASIDEMGRSIKPAQIQHWLQEHLGGPLEVDQVQRTALLLQESQSPVHKITLPLLGTRSVGENKS